MTADDFDGTSGLTLSLDSGPAWLGLADNGDGTADLGGTPTAADLGLQTVTLTVTDGADSASKTFSLYVHPESSAVLLNEYNAVASDKFLNGGDQTTDEDGGSASDSVFGRVEGNGGDWFELVVVGDGSAGTVDLRGWKIELADNAGFPFAAEETSSFPTTPAGPPYPEEPSSRSPKNGRRRAGSTPLGRPLTTSPPMAGSGPTFGSATAH